MIPFSRKKDLALDDPLQKPLERALQFRFLLFLGIAVSPHLIHMDKIFSGTFYLLLVYRVVAVLRPRLMPNRPILFVMTVSAILLFFFRTDSFVGSQAGIALLILMSGLKLLELTRRRDLHFSVLLGYFTVITVFLHESSMPVALLMLVSVIGMTSILIDSSRISLSVLGLFGLRKALILSLQAFPIALVLFLLFPRFSTPLWSFDFGDKIGRTGLSDLVRPGSVSGLIQSHEVAFRVLFKGPVPEPQQRYWRGPVMWHTDGLQWNRNHAMMQIPKDEKVRRIRGINYTVFLEPSQNQWLILLDLPAYAPKESRLTRDFQVVTDRPVTTTKSYEARSFTAFKPLKLDRLQMKLGLQLPGNITPRMKALVNRWREGGGASPQQIVQRALTHFNQEPFVYTLRPPLLGNNPTDEFMFETRRGFCEHYATSFTLMMRLAGIPSRLVTGYLGGEFNPQGDYMLVRQSDAHAWSEVWLPEKGWVRVDPTSAVAPERIERSIDIDADLADGESASFVIDGSGLFTRFGRNIRWGMDALNLSWQRWIVGYDRSRQHNFLSNLGLDFINSRTLTILALCLAAVAFAIIFFIIQIGGRDKPGKITLSYRLFCRRLEAIGIQRPSYEGPLDFQSRIIAYRPDLETQINSIMADYIALVYGQYEEGWRERFIRNVAEFRPKAL
mgnify:CR=1 FL=1